MAESIFHVGVKALIQNNAGDLLLVYQEFDDDDFWDIPGGRIDEGEEVLDTLTRELKEEINVNVFEIIDQYLSVKSNENVPHPSGKMGLMLIIYRVSLGTNEYPIAQEANISIAWKNPKEAALLLQDKYPEEFCKKVARL